MLPLLDPRESHTASYFDGLLLHRLLCLEAFPHPKPCSSASLLRKEALKIQTGPVKVVKEELILLSLTWLATLGKMLMMSALRCRCREGAPSFQSPSPIHHPVHHLVGFHIHQEVSMACPRSHCFQRQICDYNPSLCHCPIGQLFSPTKL